MIGGGVKGNLQIYTQRFTYRGLVAPGAVNAAPSYTGRQIKYLLRPDTDCLHQNVCGKSIVDFTQEQCVMNVITKTKPARTCRVAMNNRNAWLLITIELEYNTEPIDAFFKRTVEKIQIVVVPSTILLMFFFSSFLSLSITGDRNRLEKCRLFH